MPYCCPPEPRRGVLDSIAAGRSVASIVAGLWQSDRTLVDALGASIFQHVSIPC